MLRFHNQSGSLLTVLICACDHPSIQLVKSSGPVSKRVGLQARLDEPRLVNQAGFSILENLKASSWVSLCRNPSLDSKCQALCIIHASPALGHFFFLPDLSDDRFHALTTQRCVASTSFSLSTCLTPTLRPSLVHTTFFLPMRSDTLPLILVALW